jgi:hypothetical protein
MTGKKIGPGGQTGIGSCTNIGESFQCSLFKRRSDLKRSALAITDITYDNLNLGNFPVGKCGYLPVRKKVHSFEQKFTVTSQSFLGGLTVSSAVSYYRQ